jgi:hypothetical protein
MSIAPYEALKFEEVDFTALGQILRRAHHGESASKGAGCGSDCGSLGADCGRGAHCAPTRSEEMDALVSAAD